MFGGEIVDEAGQVRVESVQELRVKLQAQNAMVTAIAALLPRVAGVAVEHHTQLLVDVVDRLVIAGLAIDTLFSMVGSMSSTIGDVRSLTEHSTFSTLVDAVVAAVDVLANTPEVSALDSRLVVLDRVLGELDVDVNERIKGAFNLLVQRLGVTVQGLARRVLQLEDDATYDNSTLGTESLPTHAGILMSEKLPQG